MHTFSLSEVCLVSTKKKNLSESPDSIYFIFKITTEGMKAEAARCEIGHRDEPLAASLTAPLGGSGGRNRVLEI